MIQPRRGAGEFMASCLGALLIAGLMYVGVLMLNDAPIPEGTQMVEGAIRLAQPQRDKPVQELQRKQLDTVDPPKQLPRQFTSRAKKRPTKPVLSARTPAFSADMHPGLTGGIAMPSGNFGSIGFSMDEVDDIPQVVRSIPPVYPYAAKRNRVEGKVVVRLLVTAKGTPEHLSIESSTPEGVFDKAAVNAAKRWRFQPGKYKGEAVDTWVLLPFIFELTQ
ncbi:TonB family protein [Pseudodesulfovibrio sp. JC047]|uniref:energy transducer TonB n=1 Tax=Pseudodesulfovibrio sp. JC047 TaxID=2683199 RepID=UPI0013D3C29D|nr:energy transducer TonB [Pseudodesulfovibrio sp. JC047]NDV19834.1 TonB family protein [Pseudodesulfovibrio sp. JC047]